jgi:hypothetical protein
MKCEVSLPQDSTSKTRTLWGIGTLEAGGEGIVVELDKDAAESLKRRGLSVKNKRSAPVETPVEDTPLSVTSDAGEKE